jgi:4-amino-4-deoxy-L-arabinose transferase-like glycosyltransferase
MSFGMLLAQGCQRIWRPGRDAARDVRVDLYWLLGLGLLLMGVGIGLRDPWPADEPRFALVAQDMVRSGQWLIPMIGGDTYADKPPLFFWMIASVYALTGTLRIAFQLPSLLASLGSVALIYDLGRRLWSREVGLAAGLLLLGTVQFVWQGRQAQIDATVCFWIVLGLYGLLRHLLLGPDWRWYYVGFAAAGLGIITKGVGFLPLLVLLPYAVLRDSRWSPRPVLLQPGQSAGRWALGPVFMLAAIGLWLFPMLLVSINNPELAAYRDEILFKQTINRYANSWTHIRPAWYFVVNVIPLLWLPVSALLPWAVSGWRDAWRARDLRIALLLIWPLLLLIFFSLSSGKRGVYILPALPAVCLAMAPVLMQKWSRAGVRRVLLGLALFIGVLCLSLAAYLLAMPQRRLDLAALYGIDPPGPLLCIGLLIIFWCALARLRFAVVAWLGTLATVLMVLGLWVNPAMNPIRSSETFVRRVEAMTAPASELGCVSCREENLLMSQRVTVNFGHARWNDWQQEADDAAAWFAEKPGRMLLVNERVRQRCFASSSLQSLQDGNRDRWFLISEGVDADCVRRGHLTAALTYTPAKQRSAGPA